MAQIFNKIGLAVTFSPTGKALLKEVKRLQELFGSGLLLIHVGKKTAETEKLLSGIISDAGIDANDYEIIWEDGDPGETIIKNCKRHSVDLLVAGALEKESFLKYYLGSVARKIMRSAPCSTLILTRPKEDPVSFKRFFVSADYSNADEKTIRTTHAFASLENASELVIIRDFHLPGLAITVLDSGSSDQTQENIEKWILEEEQTMKVFIKEMNLTGVPIKIKCLYGKEGWEAGNYARLNEADILSVAAPAKKLKFFDRLFSHEIEYLFEDLPSNLLIIR